MLYYFNPAYIIILILEYLFVCLFLTICTVLHAVHVCACLFFFTRLHVFGLILIFLVSFMHFQLKVLHKL